MTPFELFAYCVAVVSGLIGGLVLVVLGIFVLLIITGIPFRILKFLDKQSDKFFNNGGKNGKTQSWALYGYSSI